MKIIGNLGRLKLRRIKRDVFDVTSYRPRKTVLSQHNGLIKKPWDMLKMCTAFLLLHVVITLFLLKENSEFELGVC